MEETKDEHIMTEHVTLIVAGGELSLPFFEQQLQQYPKHTLIAADRGLEYCMSVGREPDYVIGDFDSLDEKVREAFIAKEMVQIAEPYLGEAARDYSFTLPWRRMFEVEVTKKEMVR